jgi:hypothetical protein
VSCRHQLNSSRTGGPKQACLKLENKQGLQAGAPETLGITRKTCPKHGFGNRQAGHKVQVGAGAEAQELRKPKPSTTGLALKLQAFF